MKDTQEKIDTDEENKSSKIPKPTLQKSKLSQLSSGLLMLNLQKEMDEPGYTAIGSITPNRKVVSRRNQYSTDLERVIEESKLTTGLLSDITKAKEINQKTYQPEDIIIYYNGVFLDQVHQIKDKLFRLIWFLLLVPETTPDHLKGDPRKVKHEKFIEKNMDILKEIGISDLLQQWGSGKLAVALRKRTQHHHFVSTLRLNSDFQNITMSRIFLNPTSADQLSELVKKRVAEIGEEAFKKWREDTVQKQQDTITEIEQNIEQIAQKLINHFKIPNKPEDIAKIANKYTQFLSSMNVENKAHISKIEQFLKDVIDKFIEFNQQQIGKNLVSIYLVGSCGRGEFVAGRSDINFYVITKSNNYNSLSHKPVPPRIDPIFMSWGEFLSEEHEKDRFICWSDGILLAGEKIKLESKKFPKPGTFLCLLLNRGFIEKLKQIKEEVAALKDPSAEVLRQFSLKTVRIIMDFDFGVAMANKPFYTASRSEKIAYTKESWPNGRRTLTIEQIYKDGIIRQEDFPMLIDVFLEKAEINYQKLLDVEAKIVTEDDSK